VCATAGVRAPGLSTATMGLVPLVRAMRPAFLVLAPVSVLLGLATALAARRSVSLSLFGLALFGALLAHISVNTLNEYHDFRSGLDATTRRTVFSGGSGALPTHPEMARRVLFVGLFSLALTGAIGLYLLSQRSAALLPFGLAGLVLVATYTPWIIRSPWLCLVAPGLGFGVLIVVGTQVVLTGAPRPLTWLVSLVPFFLVNNLLLLNQYPDMEADARVGRRHVPVVYGVTVGNLVYGLFAFAAYVLVGWLVFAGLIPVLGFIGLIPMVFALAALGGAIRYGARIGEHPRYLAANVAAAVLTPLLLAFAMLYG
jgi:1,4-dihydroxy-2-naphthoate octaprenyltransferase